MIDAIIIATTAPVGSANGQQDGFHEPIYGHVQHQL